MKGTLAKWGVAAAAAALAALGGGCEFGGSSSSTQRVGGTWTGSGAYDQGTVISQFELRLNQDGNAVSGSYTVTRTGRNTMTGAVNGSVSGSSVNLTLSPHGMAEGRVDGNTMRLYWYESGFGGVGGGGNVTLTR